MKILIASDIHGSAYYCRRLVERIEDENVSNATPIIYAIADNTTAIVSNKSGNINFYDGRAVTSNSIKNIITKVLTNYEIWEEVNKNVVTTTLKLIETDQEDDSDLDDSSDNQTSTEENVKKSN